MEGVPRISMMSCPLKKSANNPDFKIKLKRFIRDEYKEDPESYNTEIHELEALRAGAIHISKDFSGCSTLKKYFCQLNFLKTRFPMLEAMACAIEFSWHDVFSETVHTWKDVEFEMSCILYNIGALHSELGATDNRQTADGMKNACTHFQCAAWAFQHLRHNYQNFFTQDLSPDTLSIMTNICLAQAQECILEKSLIDNRKSTITAKVALQIVEYYQLASKTCDQMIKDAEQYSDKVIKSAKKWKKPIELKSHYYQCISFLYRGMQAEDESKYGERITFYKAALEKLNEAIKIAKALEKTDNVHDTIQFTFDVVQGKLAIAEKENEFVYHERVPELCAISSEIKGVALVKGIPFKFDDPEIAGPDIFGRLVPMEAHEVSSLYSEEKAKVLRHYTSKIEAKNEALDKILIALQLDQIDLHSSIKKVPQELVDCCAALSVNRDAVKRLTNSMGKLSGMFHDVEDNLGEIEDLLKEEEQKDQDYQKIMGSKRPPSNVISELHREVQKYKSAHSVASETNQTLHEALSKHVGNLQVLMKPFDEVMKHIPAFEGGGEADEEAINQMKRLKGKVEEMRKQRVNLEQQLRESIHADDITKKIVIKIDSDLAELFKEELKKHDKIIQVLDQNLLAQENIIRALTEANANYAETRKKTVQVMKRRNKIIEELLSSYESYDELLSKCNKGIEFYTKLDTNVAKLLQRVRSVCKVQEEERETSMKSLINKTKGMSMNPMNPSMGMNLNYNNIPPGSTGGMAHFGGGAGIIPQNFSMPASPNPPLSSTGGGHLKLKDVLAMKKQNIAVPTQIHNQTPIPTPVQIPNAANNQQNLGNFQNYPTGGYFPQNQNNQTDPQSSSAPPNNLQYNNTPNLSQPSQAPINQEPLLSINNYPQNQHNYFQPQQMLQPSNTPLQNYPVSSNQQYSVPSNQTSYSSTPSQYPTTGYFQTVPQSSAPSAPPNNLQYNNTPNVSQAPLKQDQPLVNYPQNQQNYFPPQQILQPNNTLQNYPMSSTQQYSPNPIIPVPSNQTSYSSNPSQSQYPTGGYFPQNQNNQTVPQSSAAPLNNLQYNNTSNVSQAPLNQDPQGPQQPLTHNNYPQNQQNYFQPQQMLQPTNNTLQNYPVSSNQQYSVPSTNQTSYSSTPSQYPQQQNQPQQPPPPTEYNPNESFLAKYVKQHLGDNYNFPQ